MFKNKKDKPTRQKELFEKSPSDIEVDNKNYSYNLNVIESFIKLGLVKEKARKLYREGFNIIEKEEVRKEIVSNGRLLDEYFFEKIDYTNYMILKGNVSNPTGLLLSAIKQNYTSKEIENNKKIKENRKKRAEATKIKEQQEEQLVVMRKKLSDKEDNIIKKLVSESDHFFEGILKGEHPELWVGYNQSKSLEENCFAARGFFKAKLNAIIRREFSEEFVSLEPEILEYEIFKKQVYML